jgi:hypothetical protein
MSRLPKNGLRAAELALGVLELRRIQQASALVALVATGIPVATFWARANDEAVGEEFIEG